MYRLAILVALFALFAAGCGGGSSDSSDEGSDRATAAVGGASDTAKKAPATGAGEKPATKQKKKEGERSGDSEESDPEGSDDHGEGDEGHLSHEDVSEALAKAPAKTRNKQIRAAAQAVLLRFGLRLADVEIRDRGRRLNVLVTRASACNAVAKDEPNMVVLIQQAVPIVKSVRFEVAGTGQQLGYYVLGCKREQMPDGPGRVVFKHTGVSGPYTSPRFEIKTKKWSLEWENQGTSMAVIVIPRGGESKRKYFEPVGAQKRGAGRNVYTGSGTFELKIHGAALWSVRVKEIR